MTEETRVARRPVRRVPDVRCRVGAAVPHLAGRAAGLRVGLARVHGDAAVAAVSGEIDLHTADTLRTRLVELHAAGHRLLVVDFSAVQFCDATGLGALVAARNHLAARGGEIRVAAVRPAQVKVLRITGLDRLFPLYADVDAALTAEGTSTAAR